MIFKYLCTDTVWRNKNYCFFFVQFLRVDLLVGTSLTSNNFFRCLEEMYNNEREIIWNMLPRSVQIQVVACCRSVIFSADLGTEKPENSNFEIQTWQTLSRTLLIFENLVKPEPEVCSKLEPELGCLSGPRQHYCYWENLFLLVWCI